MPAAINATVATCRTCNGWTLLIMNFADDTTEDLRSNAKSITEAVKRGRDIHTMTPDDAKLKAATVCSCPRPVKPARRK